MKFCSIHCTWLYLLVAFVVRSGADCLEGAVPEFERSYIKDVTGEDVEIELVSYDWPSAKFITFLAKTLIQEALGYKAKISPSQPFSVLEAVLSLTGCDDMVCSTRSHGSHVVLESWLGAYGGDYDAFGLRHPDKLPEDLGSMGYAGEEAMFVSSKLAEEAYEDSGQSLNWYRSYNASRSLVKTYFSSVLDLPVDQFALCNDTSTMWTEPAFMNDYARWSGDTEGLIEVPGGYHVKCHGGHGRFWISPACRHNVPQCIPILSSQYSWLVDAFMAWSTAYAIPAAVGILGRVGSTSEASRQYFYSLARTYSVLYYWFRPDTSQVAFNPHPIVFPAHAASEWAVGNKRTAAVGSYIGKLVSRSLRGQGARVVTFLTNLKLDLMEMQEFLGRKDETNSWGDVACEWIISNQDRWEGWVPKETTCSPGFGLVDGVGAKVASRDAAVGCALCSPGTSSLAVLDKVGRTHVCRSCDAGTFQELSGQTLCLSCPPGRIASEAGSSTCEACKFGTYNNASGMEACEMCGTGSPQWTTSRMTQIHGTKTWIQVEGADSVALCHCIEGWFLGENGECHECTEGARCPGSSEVEVLPGYFSFSKDPGSIYRCHGNALRCPGGLPGTCADGRDSTSVACSTCRPGLHATEAGCIPCEDEEHEDM